MSHKCLVTGAGGFVGSNLAEYLLEQGYSVKAMFRNDSNPNIDLLKQKGAEIIFADVTDPKTLEGKFKDVDFVFHTAAKVTDWGKKKDFYLANVKATENVLNAAANENVKRLIFLSSDSVYGYEKDHNGTKEDDPATNWTSEHYTWSKIEAEKLCNDYAKSEKIETVIARLGWVWGPRDNTIFPRLIEFLKSKTAFVINKGDNLINLAYIGNVAHALELCAVNDKAKNQVYNINDNSQKTYKEFTSAILEKLGRKNNLPSVLKSFAYFLACVSELISKIIFSKKGPIITRFAVNQVSSQLDFSTKKIERDLKFKPIVSFEDGLKNTFGWFFNQDKK